MTVVSQLSADAAAMFGQAAAVVSQSAAAGTAEGKTASAGAAASSLPLGLVEQVFTAFEQTAQVVQENTLGQPAPLLGPDSSEGQGEDSAAVSGALTPAGRQILEGGAWEDCLASLSQAAVRGKSATAGELPGSLTLGDDQAADMAGLEAFFAREGGK